jgi:hypothetical protein
LKGSQAERENEGKGWFVMRKLLCTMFFFVAAVNLVAGGTSVPKYVNSLDDLGAVKAKAQETKVPIVFICSDFELKCPIRKGDNKDYLEAFKNYLVVVVPADGNNQVKADVVSKLPELVRNALVKSNLAPRVVVGNSDLTEIIDSFEWVGKKNNERKKRFEDAIKKINASLPKSGVKSMEVGGAK